MGSAKDRWEHLLESAAWDRLKAEKPERLKLVVPIDGDLHLPEIIEGEPEERKKVMDELDCIMNVAAYVNFTQTFRDTFKTNALSVIYLIKFAQACQPHVVISHVSTCFTHPTPYPATSDKVVPVQFCPELPMEFTGDIKDTLDRLWEHPEDFEGALADWSIESSDTCNTNFYTQTKAMGEYFYNYCSHGMEGRWSTTRVSVLAPSLLEPSVGWVDSVQASGAIALAYGQQYLNILPSRPNHCMDQIPVDIGSNGYVMITAALVGGWLYPPDVPTSARKPIFQVGSSADNPCSSWWYLMVCREYLFSAGMTATSIAPGTIWTLPVKLFIQHLNGLNSLYKKISNIIPKNKKLQKLKMVMAFKTAVLPFAVHNQCFFNTYCHELSTRMSPEAQSKYKVTLRNEDMRYVAHVWLYGYHKYLLRKKDVIPPHASQFPAFSRYRFPNGSYIERDAPAFGRFRNPENIGGANGRDQRQMIANMTSSGNAVSYYTNAVGPTISPEDNHYDMPTEKKAIEKSKNQKAAKESAAAAGNAKTSTGKEASLPSAL
jgi:hypothetical protein